MFRHLIFIVLCGCLFAGQPASAGSVSDLLEKFPAKNPAEQGKIAEDLVKLGPDAIEQLVEMLVPPGKGDDTKARYALHGLALHVSRPGADAERRMFARALVAELGRARPAAVKGFLIRQLRLAGGKEAAGALGGLLLDEELCEYAAQALLTIREGAAEQLRRALPRATDENRLTIIQALGVLGDRASVPELLKAARDSDREVRLVALFALGKIGDPRAAETLKAATSAESVYERSKATDALLLFARRLVAAGRKGEAGRLYRELWENRTGPQERHVRCAALQGLASAFGAQAMDQLRSAMKSDDPQIRAVATEAAIATPGEDITRKWIEQMESGIPGVRKGTLEILARRGDRVALRAIVEAMEDADESVRLAAIDAAAALGGEEAVRPLVRFLGGERDRERRAAELALQRMPGKAATRAIAGSLKGAPSRVRCGLLRILATRGEAANLDLVLSYTKDGDESVRAAALEAAGALADVSAVPKLLDLMVRSRTSRERRAAEKSVLTVCAKTENKDDCAGPVLAVLPRADTSARCSLLRVLGRIGGGRALEAVRSAVKARSPEVQDAAVRVLADWPDPSASAELLSIAKTAAKVTHRVLALRGYVRLAGLQSDRPVEERLRLYRDAMSVARRPEEKKLVLAGLGEVKHLDALKMLSSYLSDPALQGEAAAAIAKIARVVSGAGRDEAMSALQKILQVCRDERVRKQAQEAIDFIEKYDDYVTAWQVAGPYAVRGKDGTGLFDIVFPPEKPGGGGARWRLWTGSGAKPWVIDIKRVLGGDNRAAYLRVQVSSPRRQEATLELGSDDGIKVWLNGEVVHAKNVPRGLKEGEDKVKVTLNSGWNTLMLKITQGGGDWAACGRVRAADGTKLKGLRIRAE